MASKIETILRQLMHKGEISIGELRLSLKASETLGYGVVVFLDGVWHCDPMFSVRLHIGDGSTPDAAIEDCRQLNAESK